MRKIGPLPAGAWIALVGGGLAITYYLNRNRKVPQVSTGTDTATGDTQAPLQTTGSGTLVPANVTVVPNQPTTNTEWIQAALQAMQQADPLLDVAAAEEALKAYVNGQSLSAAQAAYVNLARALIGNPPLSVPNPAPLPIPIPPTPPPSSSRVGHHYESTFHRIAVQTRVRDLVHRYSDSTVATPDNVETALRRTIGDPRNVRYLSFYRTHGGAYPAKAAVWVTGVKRGGAVIPLTTGAA